MSYDPNEATCGHGRTDTEGCFDCSREREDRVSDRRDDLYAAHQERLQAARKRARYIVASAELARTSGTTRDRMMASAAITRDELDAYLEASDALRGQSWNYAPKSLLACCVFEALKFQREIKWR
jgi:hypothetical protein